MIQVSRFFLLMLSLVILPPSSIAQTIPVVEKLPIEEPINPESNTSALVLTTQEQAWLKTHPIIRVGVTRDFPPYEWIDEQDRYVGPVAEYMGLLEKKLGVQFNIIHDRPWAEILEMARRGELDMLSCVNMTPERSQFLTFTEPYKSTHIVIIDNGQGSYIGSLDGLNGKRVSVEKDYFMQEFMRNKHKQIHVVPAEDTLNALDMVVSGAADAYVGDAGTANYFIRKGALFSLRFTGQTEYDSQYRIAVSKSSPELATILGKVMAAIPKEEPEAIFDRWLGLKIEQGIKTKTLVTYSTIVLAFFLLFAYWLIRLKQEISKRRKIEDALADNNYRFKIILDNIFAYVALLDSDGVIQEVNKAPLEGSGYCREDVLGQHFSNAPWWSYDEKVQAEIREAIKAAAKGETRRYDTIIKKGDRFIHIDFQISPICDDTGKIIGLLPTAVDMSKRKQAEELIKHTEFLKDQALDLAQAGHWFINFDESEEFYTSSERVVEIFGDPPRDDMSYHIMNDWYVNIEVADKAAAKATLQNYLSAVEGTVPRYDMIHPYKRPIDGKIIWIHVLGQVVRDTHGKATNVYGVIMDITELKRAEHLEQHRQEILQMLADNRPLANILDKIVCNVEALKQDILCSILLLDNEGKHLKHGAAPSLPEFYNKAIDGLAIGPSVGSCGTACFTEKRVVVEDIKTHPYWAPYVELANQAELASCWSQPIISAQGKVLGSFAIYHRQVSQPTFADLTFIEEEAVLTALAIEKARDLANLQLAAQVFTHAREGIFITDSDCAIIEVNDTFTHITGYSRDEALGQNPRFFQSGRQEPEFYIAMWKSLLENDQWSGEIWNRHKDGKEYAEMLTISTVRDALGKTQNYVALFTDITSLKEHQHQLEHIAHYDPLTGLPNRVLLADRLQQAIIQCNRRKCSLGVAYLDLDGFKAINDGYGHDVGDELLIKVAQRMKEVLREGDTLSRIGGDEFVAVLVDIDNTTECEGLLGRLLHAAADSIILGNYSLKVSASIGITFYPQDSVDADQLLRHADQAMYNAKQAGKNRYHIFDIKQDALVRVMRENVESIQRAFEQREFVLYYQPKVNMRTGEVFGVEALIRWLHPERGVLSPAHILPIIENHPFSVELGEWVIDTALSQMSEWYASGFDLSVSVNVSAFQLQQQNFSSLLLMLLAKYPNVPPGDLELEVLETSAIEDIATVSKVMLACRDYGVHFALDDFGTGYSSLIHLRRLPADVLKIDQTFVRDMLNDADDLAIVRGVIGLASIFNRKVIAEGVETVEHGSELLLLGCDLAQGYGIAWPMPAAELPTWIENWKPNPTWSIKT